MCTAVPTGCTITGAYWLYSRYDWKQHSVQVEGYVVEQLESKSNGNSIVWQPIVEYVYRGEKQRYVSSLKSNPKPYKDGEKVKVLIGAEDDSVVRLDRFTELYLCPVVLCGFSIPFLIIGLVVVAVCIVFLKASNDKSVQQGMLRTSIPDGQSNTKKKEEMQ